MSIKMGKRCRVGSLKILGKGEVKIGDDCQIGENVAIDVTERFVLGDRSVLGDFFTVAGRDVEIDKEFYSRRFCQIGGGSCKERASSLRMGYWCHMGSFSNINTARAVVIGNEVGLGEATKLFTHGAYLSHFNGFPVDFGEIKIGNNVWLPNAIVMPNVSIGHDTVVGAGAVITKSLPAGCFAAGVPAKVIKENCYPAIIHPEQQVQMLQDFITHFVTNIQPIPHLEQVGLKIFVDQTLFDLHEMRIEGPANDLTERFKNELRRYGCRFRYYNKDGIYTKW